MEMMSLFSQLPPRLDDLLVRARRRRHVLLLPGTRVSGSQHLLQREAQEQGKPGGGGKGGAPPSLRE